jgi:hypothetical protein
MRLALLFLLAAAAAFAQRPSFGIKAGVPFTDLVKSESWKNGMYRPTSSRYTIGPTIELLLPFRLSIEFDALYRPVEYRLLSVGATSQSIDASGSAWLFPLLAKYRLSRRFVAPYLAAGLAFNRLSGLKQLGDLDKATVSGLVAAVGLEGRLPVGRISPEIRYTRWSSDNLRNLSGGFGLSNRTQIEALVGITF